MSDHETKRIGRYRVEHRRSWSWAWAGSYDLYESAERQLCALKDRGVHGRIVCTILVNETEAHA